MAATHCTVLSSQVRILASQKQLAKNSWTPIGSMFFDNVQSRFDLELFVRRMTSRVCSVTHAVWLQAPRNKEACQKQARASPKFKLKNFIFLERAPACLMNPSSSWVWAPLSPLWKMNWTNERPIIYADTQDPLTSRFLNWMKSTSKGLSNSFPKAQEASSHDDNLGSQKAGELAPLWRLAPKKQICEASPRLVLIRLLVRWLQAHLGPRSVPRLPSRFSARSSRHSARHPTPPRPAPAARVGSKQGTATPGLDDRSGH